MVLSNLLLTSPFPVARELCSVNRVLWFLPVSTMSGVTVTAFDLFGLVGNLRMRSALTPWQWQAYTFVQLFRSCKAPLVTLKCLVCMKSIRDTS